VQLAQGQCLGFNFVQAAFKSTLDGLRIPVDAIICHNVMCENASHFTALNDFSNALIHALSIPLTLPFLTLPNPMLIDAWKSYQAGTNTWLPYVTNPYSGMKFG
jgi:hypothetical protein